MSERDRTPDDADPPEPNLSGRLQLESPDVLGGRDNERRKQRIMANLFRSRAAPSRGPAESDSPGPSQLAHPGTRPAEGASIETQGPPGQLDDLRPGKVFSQYELIASLGQGGFGAVFLARDRRLDRDVAMKFLLHDDPALAKRFRAEARATARCKHENVVTIHDVDERDGYSFMVLEYIEGATLRTRMRAATEPWSAKEALAVARPIVAALEHAHGLGIVHRDLKPENVMLTASGVVKVLDLGIAKFLRAPGWKGEANEETAVPAGDTGGTAAPTRAGALVGTMPYMAPEQWRADPVTERTDIWAVGVILWELLAGRHPLAPLSASTLMAVGESDEPLPSLCEERPELDSLAVLVDLCLAKDPAARPQSAQVLRAELERLAERLEKPARDTAPSWSHRCRQWFDRHTYKLMAMTTLTVLGVLAFWLFWPPLSVSRFRAGAGVLVASHRGASTEVIDARVELADELQRLGEPYVQTVELPRYGVDDAELVREAGDAGATLVVVIEDGPEVRMLPVPGTRTNELLSGLPPIPVARSGALRPLAHLLFALAWLGSQDPGSLTEAVQIPLSEARHWSPEVALLALHLLDMRGGLRGPSAHEARTLAAGIAARCTAEEKTDYCPMALFLYYGVLCPECPGAADMLANVVASDSGALASAAMLDLLRRRCAETPAWVYESIEQWHGELPDGDCRQLALAVPATCLVVEARYPDHWLQRLAAPSMAEYRHCGPLRSRVLARQAASFGRANRWRDAAQTHLQAAALSPGEYGHLLNWAEALLLEEPRAATTATEIRTRLGRETVPLPHRLRAAFARFLANPATGEATILCALYRDAPTSEAALPHLGPLARRLCTPPDSRECRIYHLLTNPKGPTTPHEVCQLLEASSTSNW